MERYNIGEEIRDIWYTCIVSINSCHHAKKKNYDTLQSTIKNVITEANEKGADFFKHNAFHTTQCIQMLFLFSNSTPLK